MYQIKIGEQIYPVTTPHWVKEVNRYDISMIVNAAASEATGVRFNEVIYHIAGKPGFEHHDLQTVELTEGEYIPPSNISEARAVKLAELGDACENAIYAGVSVETSQGAEQFSLTLEDQTNIGNLMLQAQAEQPVLYHADGELCRWFVPDEFMKIVAAIIAHKTYHTTLVQPPEHMGQAHGRY